MSYGSSNWDTASEIAFVLGLGTYHEIGQHAKKPHLERGPVRVRQLLNGYIESCELRRVWKGLDKSEILKAAEERLSELDVAAAHDR